MIKVFIGNIPYSWSVADLLEFSGASKGDIAVDERGRSRGHGWVIANSPSHAVEIIKKHNHDAGHIKVKCQLWKNKENTNESRAS